MAPDTKSPSLLFRLLSAAFYGLASVLIIIVNKSILTAYKFPSFQFLGFGQILVTVIVLYISKLVGIVSFPDFSKETAFKIWPLPLFYFGNLVFGLGGTQKISLPMLTVLRRFSILLTMILELLVLGIRPSWLVQFSVFSMIFGAIVAASDDLAFNALGYSYIMLNNVCTAANGVYMKKN